MTEWTDPKPPASSWQTTPDPLRTLATYARTLDGLPREQLVRLLEQTGTALDNCLDAVRRESAAHRLTRTAMEEWCNRAEALRDRMLEVDEWARGVGVDWRTTRWRRLRDIIGYPFDGRWVWPTTRGDFGRRSRS